MDQNLQQPESEGQKDLISDYANEVRQMDLEYAQSGIRKARNALFFAGVMIFISEIVSVFQGGYGFTWYLLLIALVEGGIFVALALWTKKKPYYAVVGGIIAFIGIMLFSVAVNAYADGWGGGIKALVGGFIFKIFILVALFRALSDAKSVQAAQKEVF
jgi:hypothetical protein